MRVSLNWLREFVDIDLGAAELAHHLTMLGLEIESVHVPGEELENIAVGEITSIEPHPNADKLVVCKTDVGEGEPLQIICGADNMKVGDKVPTAKVGGRLPGGFDIARRKMRGVESHGMMCSERELGVGEDQGGLLILAPDAPVGADAVEHLGLDDVFLEIEVTPNRGDWAGVIGIARELSASLGASLRQPYRGPSTEGNPPVTGLSSVTIDAPAHCPRYLARVALNAAVKPAPLWMRSRLTGAGLRSINNVVDITNYVLLETGHPLHAFDLDTLAERRVVVRLAEEGETLVTLDGEKRKLDRDTLVIADAREPIAVAGVMGGEPTEVGENTRNIFLESAYFNPKSIRRSARALGMATEASQRFQRGADPEMAAHALERAAALLHELAGAQIAHGVLDEYPKPVERPEVTLRYTRTNDLLGTEIPPSKQTRFITSLGFTSLEETSTDARFRAPSWRHDVSQEADLIEEIARLYNYGEIPVALPRVSRTETEFAPQDRRIRRLRGFLVGLGLTECLHMSFSSERQTEKAGLNGRALRFVKLLNPLSENMAAMRTSLIPGMLGHAAHNINHGRSTLRSFEIGPVYFPAPNETDLPQQTQRVVFLLTGNRADRHWSAQPAPVDIYDIKGLVEALFASLRLDPSVTEARHSAYTPGQCGEVRLNDTVVGAFGRVAPHVLKAFDIEQPVYLAELQLDALLAHEPPAPQFQKIPAHPPSWRDLAVLAPVDTPAGAVVQAAKEAGGKILRDVQLFDIYKGRQVPSGKKSLALNLVFQAQDRTLTDKETDKAFQKILHRLHKDFGAELR